MTSEVDPFTDIANAIFALRRAFQRQGMKPPASIELANHEDMNRLREMITREHFEARPSFDRQKPELIANISGVDIVAPAVFRAFPGGRFNVE